MGTEAPAVPASWEAALPRREPREIEEQRCFGPAAERLRTWGHRVQEALPGALRPWWPFGSSDKWSLKVRLSGNGGEERELDLDHFPLRLGRAESCPLRLPHAAVSTEHAELQLEKGQAFLMDLRSTNGTKRNGEPLTPLTPVALQAGDRIDLGPFALTVVGLSPAHEWLLRMKASDPRPRPRETVFGASNPSDRWVRVRLAGETVFVRLSAPWIRACWRRLTDLEPEDAADLDPMEEGAAQYVFHQVTMALAQKLGEMAEVGAWLTPAEAERATTGEQLWLESEVWLETAQTRLATSLAFPVPEPPVPRWFDDWGDLAWPASVCLGLVRLKVADWRHVEPGDALIPDVFWPTGWLGGEQDDDDLGPAFLRVRHFWQGGRLLRSGAGAKLRLDTRWLATPGGDWLMPEEDSLAGEGQSLPVDDLELQVAIELDRFPLTVGEIRRWQTGEVVTLRQGPGDPVRLVVETGLQRRLLGEGRVVLVNGKLGIEILRILTRLEDRREPGA